MSFIALPRHRIACSAPPTSADPLTNPLLLITKGWPGFAPTTPRSCTVYRVAWLALCACCAATPAQTPRQATPAMGKRRFLIAREILPATPHTLCCALFFMSSPLHDGSSPGRAALAEVRRRFSMEFRQTNGDPSAAATW